MLTATTKSFSTKSSYLTLRRFWRRGTYTDFDYLLMKILGCPREKAERIRESWLDLDLLAYDSEGYLVWTNFAWGSRK